MHPIHKHGSGMRSAERYDAKEAYNKKLSSKARMHYLEMILQIIKDLAQ